MAFSFVYYWSSSGGLGGQDWQESLARASSARSGYGDCEWGRAPEGSQVLIGVRAAAVCLRFRVFESAAEVYYPGRFDLRLDDFPGQIDPALAAVEDRAVGGGDDVGRFAQEVVGAVGERDGPGCR